MNLFFEEEQCEIRSVSLTLGKGTIKEDLEANHSELKSSSLGSEICVEMRFDEQ